MIYEYKLACIEAGSSDEQIKKIEQVFDTEYKAVQYLAGHENSKITMDIYTKVKYNIPQELAAVVNGAFNKG